MKKPSAKLRQEIARLQEQLKQAETRDAERIGRIALKAGLGEFQIEETELLAALEDLSRRFRSTKVGRRGDAVGTLSGRHVRAEALGALPASSETGEG